MPRIAPRSPTAILLITACSALLAACGGDEPAVFTHGVASGDVTPDGVVLWTRVDREATLTLEVATDAAFENVVLEQEIEAPPERDFTAKGEVSGLEPGTQYYYRFRDGDSISPTGQFRTAPLDGEAAPVRFVFSGDSDGTVQDDGTRPFDFAVLDAARRENADFFLYFGDTIYADSPFGERAETLDAYRAKYKENREIQLLRDLLASTAVYTVWDDHEVVNDFSGQTVDRALLGAGRQAFREYMPISGDTQPDVLFRRFRWGSAVDLIILDERSYRSDSVEDSCPPGADEPDLLPGLGLPGVPSPYRDFRAAIDLPPDTDLRCVAALLDPDRTMLGRQQKQFLLDALRDSDATFKFIVNEVPIAELAGLPYDRWEGYRAERDEILTFIRDERIANVVFLTTDFHANIISPVRIKLDGAPVATEVITGPIAHETVAEAIARTQGEDLVAGFELLLRVVPRSECVALDAFSYGLVEVDPAAGTTTITLKDESGSELCKKALTAS